MGGIFGDEELERVFEFIDGAEDSGRLESVKREARRVLQLVAGRTDQSLTRAQARRPRRPTGSVGPSTSLNGATQIFSWLSRCTWPRTPWRQRRLGVRRACALPVAAASRVDLTKQTARSQGSAGVLVAAAVLRGLATPHGGAGDRGIELCKRRVLALHYNDIEPGGALILSVYMHTGAGLTQENWQILSTMCQ